MLKKVHFQPTLEVAKQLISKATDERKELKSETFYDNPEKNAVAQNVFVKEVVTQPYPKTFCKITCTERCTASSLQRYKETTAKSLEELDYLLKEKLGATSKKLHKIVTIHKVCWRYSLGEVQLMIDLSYLPKGGVYMLFTLYSESVELSEKTLESLGIDKSSYPAKSTISHYFANYDPKRNEQLLTNMQFEREFVPYNMQLLRLFSPEQKKHPEVHKNSIGRYSVTTMEDRKADLLKEFPHATFIV